MTPKTPPHDVPLSFHKTIRKHLPEARIAEFVRAVWLEVLVPICGVRGDPDTEGFTDAHLDQKFPCTEWRIFGGLGFGGKFRLADNLTCVVDCYPEDATPARREIVLKANIALKELGARFGIPQTSSS